MATFSSTFSRSWRNLQIKDRETIIRTRYEKTDYETLKAAYIEKYGYQIAVPQWDDIVRIKPTFMKTDAEIKAEKLQAFQRILASPSPDIAKKYASVMTWVDNVQDAASVIFPFFRMLVRWSPKLLSRFIPYAGWGLLFFDYLQLMNYIGRLPMTPFKSKRLICQQTKGNPFSKQANWKRMDRIAKWDPTFADVLQVVQTTENLTGVGLRLGSIVGFIQDMFWGAVGTATGERVSFKAEWPKLNFHELKATNVMKAAAMVSTSGQTFSDEFHFWSLASWAAGVNIMTPLVHDYDLAGIVDDPLSAVLPAPVPEDPITIEVIKSQGLSVEDGVGWPANGEKTILFKDLSDHIGQTSTDTYRDYLIRHQKDAYGFIASHLIDDAQYDLFDALEPQAEYVADDTPAMRVIFEMVKDPIIPTGTITPEQSRTFANWINDYTDQYEHIPRIPEVKTKLDDLGIQYKTTYPDTPDPETARLFPGGFDTSDLI